MTLMNGPVVFALTTSKGPVLKHFFHFCQGMS